MLKKGRENNNKCDIFTIGDLLEEKNLKVSDYVDCDND